MAPRAYNIGNHFNEYATFDCVWSRYPSHAQRAAFCRAYLGPARGEADVARLVVEAEVFALASNVHWVGAAPYPTPSLVH